MSTYNMFINNRNISIDKLISLCPDEQLKDVDLNNKYLIYVLFDRLNKCQTKIGGSMSEAPFRICGIYKEESFSSREEFYKLLTRYDLVYDFGFENNLSDDFNYFSLFTQNQPYIAHVKPLKELPENFSGRAKFQILDPEERNKIIELTHTTYITYILGDFIISFAGLLFSVEKKDKNKIYPLKQFGPIFKEEFFNIHNKNPIIDYYISYVKKLNRENLYRDEFWSLK